MNCQDVSLALDDRDIGALTEAQRREFDAHLASCPDCAHDWDIHRRMVATQAPPMPAALVAQVRVLVAARSGSSSGRRAPHRLLLLGTVLLVGAAAAMLAMRLTGTPTPQAAVAAPDPDATSALTPVQPTSEALPLPVAGQAEPAEPVASKEALPEVKPFTVRVMPLKNETTDATSSSAAVTMYAAFVERLRAVPGLTLLDQDDPEAHPVYRITITGMSSGNQFGGTVGAETLKPDGFPSGAFYFGLGGDMPATCASHLPVSADSSPCQDPEGIATNMVGRLRKMLFPPDPALRRQLQVRLLDKSLDAQQRLQALSELATYGRANQLAGGAGAVTQVLRDPAVLRGAVDLATNAATPAQRAQAWYTLRGADSAELVQPLLASLRKDPDREVRLAAIGVLDDGFEKDPRARVALETSAQQETDPMLRALAQRALGGANGDSAWRQYLLTSLKDTSRSSLERIEALLYQMNLPASEAFRGSMAASGQRQLALLLDADSITALVSVLPGAAVQSRILGASAASLVNELAQLDHPAITEMLLASVQGDSRWLDPVSAAYALGQLSRRDQPRVRAVLEKMRADDPIPQVRQAATESLNRPATTASVSAKPRLGLVFNTVKVGDAAPPELIGKLVINSIGPGAGQRAGMKLGDAVLEINGSPVSSPAEAIRVMDTLPRDVDIDILIERSGEKLSLKARF